MRKTSGVHCTRSRHTCESLVVVAVFGVASESPMCGVDVQAARTRNGVENCTSSCMRFHPWRTVKEHRFA